MATSIFNSENPFTNEVHNATRISFIVVDVAGEILRKKLEEIILYKNCSMTRIRCDTNLYNNVKEYFEKNQNIFKDNSEFYADQINAMYPKNIPTSNIVNRREAEFRIFVINEQRRVAYNNLFTVALLSHQSRAGFPSINEALVCFLFT